MTSTASAWLMGDGDIAELDDVMAAAGVPVRALTEYPPWMKQAIARKLRDSFGEVYWTDIMESFGTDVSDYLQRGLRDGLSIRRMALDMAEMMEDGQYARNRATNIARTEAAGALNGARREGMDSLAEELGIGNWGDAPMRPVWLSVLGTTTRDTHADLDGVPCDKDGMWELGGVRVPHPGHPDLPPEERCNCQCTTVMEFGLRDEESQQLIEDYYRRVQERSVELQTKAKADNDSRLEEREAHPNWEALLNEYEEFARILQAPLTSRANAQRLANQITSKLGVPAVRVVFEDGPSSIGDGRLADYLAADDGKATITFFDEPNSKSVSVLVHELAHHTQQVLRGQDAHGAGHNKHFRLVAEALIGIERGDDEFSLNDWWKENDMKNESKE